MSYFEREEMLHIGDNFTTDFCGARAAGMQALYLGTHKHLDMLSFMHSIHSVSVKYVITQCLSIV